MAFYIGAMAFYLGVMAFNLCAMAFNLGAMAFNLGAMTFITFGAMTFYLGAMAFNLGAMAWNSLFGESVNSALSGAGTCPPPQLDSRLFFASSWMPASTLHSLPIWVARSPFDIISSFYINKVLTA
jgi:hypothetical protein